MRRALLAAIFLGACAAPGPDAPPAPAFTPMPGWDNARAAGVDFRALGQEPGWLLDIHARERIQLSWDYGERGAAFPLTEPTYPQEGATHYETRNNQHALAITIRRFPCQDAMSGEAFAAAVEIVIDGRTLNGCGRGV